MEPLSQNDVVQDMIDDGLVFEIGHSPLHVPEGCWGIIIETENEKTCYYISEEIKCWHMYFFGAQVFFIDN